MKKLLVVASVTSLLSLSFGTFGMELLNKNEHGSYTPNSLKGLEKKYFDNSSAVVYPSPSSQAHTVVASRGSEEATDSLPMAFLLPRDTNKLSGVDCSNEATPKRFQDYNRFRYATPSPATKQHFHRVDRNTIKGMALFQDQDTPERFKDNVRKAIDRAAELKASGKSTPSPFKTKAANGFNPNAS